MAAPFTPEVLSPVGARARVLTLAERVDRYPHVFLAVVSAIYCLAVIAAASRKPFWSDEIFTYWIAEFPRFGDVWTALQRGLECNPPLPFWLSWIILHTSGGGHILMRLPAMVGYWTMSVCLYVFVRRRASPAYGFIALIIPLFTFAAGFSIEARGYGLQLGFDGIALACWQYATEVHRRRLALAGITLGLAGALSCHYYASYLVAALLIGELTRGYLRRRIDSPCLLAVIAGGFPLLVFWPLISVDLPGAKTFWAPSSVTGVMWSYFQMLTPAFVLGLPLLVYLLLRPARRENSSEHCALGLRAWEVTVAAVLIAMPVVLFLAGLFMPLGLWDKYVILVVIGLGILLPAAVQQWTNNSAAAPDFILKFAFFCCFIPWAIFRGYGLYLQPSPAELVRQQTVVPHIRGLQIVTTDEVPFVQQYFYAPADRKEQICVLLDPAAAAKFQGDDNAQQGLISFRQWRPVAAYDYRAFVGSHPEFILVRPDGPDWLTPKLLSDGATLTLISHNERPGRFQPRTEIFLVHGRAPSALP